MELNETNRAVLRVGGGRGFVVETEDGQRLVITAAHCLPRFPPCASASYTEERTYEDLLGRLGERSRVWVECLFVDPIADVAVLGPADGQAGLFEQARAYEDLVAASSPLTVISAAQDVSAWLLSLDGRWYSCRMSSDWVFEAAEAIVGGMSGSPILADNGSAIGVLCTSNERTDLNEGGPNPRLADRLPGWLLRNLAPG